MVEGWSEIETNIVDLDDLNAELAEIDENLIRNELHWFDRDKQLARRKEIYESIHPKTVQGAKGGWHNNKSLGLENDIMSFSSDTATKVGISDRTVERSIQRAKTFTNEQGKVLKRAAIPQTDATKLVHLDEPKRATAIEAISTGKAKM